MAEARQLEEISRERCDELLAAHHVGRLGVLVDGAVMIYPVNYVYDGGRVAVRTDPGTLHDAAEMAPVAFEIDGIEEPGRGWSVVVQGTAYDVTEAIDVESELIRRLPVEPWAPGEKHHWIRIEPRSVTGRQLR